MNAVDYVNSYPSSPLQIISIYIRVTLFRVRIFRTHIVEVMKHWCRASAIQSFFLLLTTRFFSPIHFRSCFGSLSPCRRPRRAAWLPYGERVAPSPFYCDGSVFRSSRKLAQANSAAQCVSMEEMVGATLVQVKSFKCLKNDIFI